MTLTDTSICGAWDSHVGIRYVSHGVLLTTALYSGCYNTQNVGSADALRSWSIKNSDDQFKNYTNN